MSARRIIKLCLCACVVVVQLPFLCHAQPLPAPEGKVILTVTGAIDARNTSLSDSGGGAATQLDAALFDLAMLEALGLVTITTETPWTDGLVEFQGVLMRDVLDLLKASGTAVHAAALDDYVVKLPREDFRDYDVILATRVDGEPMRVRQNGPLWIIYPWSDVPALRRPLYYARSIWQLESLVVLP